MIFSELYGAYYNAVTKILKTAGKHPITKQQIQDIVREQAFSESILAIEPALLTGRWPFLRPDRTAALKQVPDRPATILEKRWLKAILLDPRMQLFECEISGLEDVEPLFLPEDICVFDKYADGDPYQDEIYIRNFRLVTSGCRYGKVINLARILKVKPLKSEGKISERAAKENTVSENLRAAKAKKESLVFELFDGRDTLERALLHFAHFEKEAERLDEKHYRVKVKYNKEDEAELVIRVLSFGPFLRVVEPESFVELIKRKLVQQYALSGNFDKK